MVIETDKEIVKASNFIKNKEIKVSYGYFTRFKRYVRSLFFCDSKTTDSIDFSQRLNMTLTILDLSTQELQDKSNEELMTYLKSSNIISRKMGERIVTIILERLIKK